MAVSDATRSNQGGGVVPLSLDLVSVLLTQLCTVERSCAEEPMFGDEDILTLYQPPVDKISKEVTLRRKQRAV